MPAEQDALIDLLDNFDLKKYNIEKITIDRKITDIDGEHPVKNNNRK